MAVQVSISVNSCKVGSTDIALPGLIYSTSDVMGTKGSGLNFDSITVECSKDNAKKCTVSYLKEPGTNKKFANSLAIELKYKTEGGSQVAIQEILICAEAGKISSVIWKMNGTEFNKNSSDVEITGPITVDIIYENQSAGTHNMVSDLTLFGYYVSAKGYKTSAGIEENTKLGSFNLPSKALHRQSSAYWTTSGDADLDEVTENWSQGGLGIQVPESVWPRAFTFIPPLKTNGTIDKPNYYIIVAYKSYKPEIGHIQILQGGANNFIDKNEYWDAGWRFGGLRYTVYAVYGDGISPALGGRNGDYKKGNQGTNASYRNTAYSYAQYVSFDYPEPLISISWYNWNNGNPVLLKDGTGVQDLKYSIVKSNTAVSIDIPNVDSQIPAGQSTSGWYVGTQSNSSINWNSSSKKNENYFNSVIPNKNLFFAFVFSDNDYLIKYKSQTDPEATFTLTYNKKLKINPVGNATTLISGATVSHKNPKTNNIESAAYTITPIEANYTIANPTTTANLIFLGWTKSNPDSTTTTLTAVWQINKITITYNKNGGTGSMASDEINYKDTTYAIKSSAFTPPAGKHFINWKDQDDRIYTPNKIYTSRYTKNLTLTAQWGSHWRKVKYVWIYNGQNWEKYKAWIQTK